LLRQARLDLFDLDIDIRKLADPHENAARDFMMAATNEPARRFRQEKHARAEYQRRNNGQTEHPAPTFNTRERVIGQIRNDDADSDSELKERDDPAPRAAISLSGIAVDVTQSYDREKLTTDP
jgi:hypothetical protein